MRDKVPSEIFEIQIRVEPDDIDELGHVNNVVYLQWVQDVAVAHWRHAAPAADQASLLWVVTRHEIDYRRPAFLKDEIILRTWVGEAHRRDFERHTEIVRASSMKTLVRARTLWCPIEPRTGRPTDVSDEVRRRFSMPPPSAATD
jgi:acyl-CoA thioester hydrolase